MTTMTTIELGEDLAYSFIGALISIARSDGEVNAEESRVLREIASEIGGGDDFDFEFALTSATSVTAFADKLREQGNHPFRSAGAGVNVETVATAFVAAARRLATADGSSSRGEDRILRTFVDLLGLDPSVLA